jgi:hypothetical protein
MAGRMKATAAMGRSTMPKTATHRAVMGENPAAASARTARAGLDRASQA